MRSTAVPDMGTPLRIEKPGSSLVVAPETLGDLPWDDPPPPARGVLPPRSLDVHGMGTPPMRPRRSDGVTAPGWFPAPVAARAPPTARPAAGVRPPSVPDMPLPCGPRFCHGPVEAAPVDPPVGSNARPTTPNGFQYLLNAFARSLNDLRLSWEMAAAMTSTFSAYSRACR